MKIANSWPPDIVVACDDNAAKFLIQPFYLDSSMPIVFCGINYDAGVYNLPSKNMTGMIEVDHILETIAFLREYAGGEKIGYIGADDMSNLKF